MYLFIYLFVGLFLALQTYSLFLVFYFSNIFVSGD